MLAVCICNYNLPDMTDRLVERLRAIVRVPWRAFVLDNGSDKAPMAENTTHTFDRNRLYTAGMNYLIGEALDHCDPAAVWIMDNDVEFPDDRCPAAPLYAALGSGYGIVSPSVVGRTAWADLRYRQGETGLIDLYAVDWVCPMIARAALDVIYPFDPDLQYGYGVDRESCYYARLAGMKIAVTRDVVIHHQPSTTYASGLHPLSADEFHRKAANGANAVLERKYGRQWRELLRIGRVA